MVQALGQHCLERLFLLLSPDPLSNNLAEPRRRSLIEPDLIPLLVMQGQRVVNLPPQGFSAVYHGADGASATHGLLSLGHVLGQDATSAADDLLAVLVGGDI